MSVTDIRDTLGRIRPGCLVTGSTNGASKGSVLVISFALAPFCTAVSIAGTQHNLAVVQVNLPETPPFTLISCYGSNDTREQLFIQNLLEPFMSTETVIMGDLNFCNTSLDHHRMSRPPKWDYMSLKISSLRIVDAYRHLNHTTKVFSRPPSHLHTSSARLDYVLITPSLLSALKNVHTSVITSDFTSNHHPVSLEFTSSLPPPPRCPS
jgi:hypothetical protein